MTDTATEFVKLWNEYEKSSQKLPGLLVTENNAMVLASTVNGFVADKNRMPTVSELAHLVYSLGDIERGGKLQYHHTSSVNSTPSSEIAELPHEEIPELKNVRTMADVRRFQKNPALMKPFANLRPGSPSFKEFNERIAFIQEHRIGDAMVTEETKETNEQAEQRERYAAIRERVSALTAKDCGSSNTGPGGGPWTKVNSLKTRLFPYLDACQQKGVPAEMVKQRVNEEIAKLQSSGING